MNEIILIGGGGHCRVVIDTIKKCNLFKISGIIDLKDKIGQNLFNIPVIGDDNDLNELFKKGYEYCFITIGSIGNPSLRIKLYNKAKEIGYKLPCIIHPTAIISEQANLGEGTFVSPGAIINAGTKIGNNCIINTGAIIDHDCVIENNVHIATGAVLSGGVTVCMNSHIGSGTSVIHNKKIGSCTIIGTGSVITKNIESNVVAYGNPCRTIKNNNV